MKEGRKKGRKEGRKEGNILLRWRTSSRVLRMVPVGTLAALASGQRVRRLHHGFRSYQEASKLFFWGVHPEEVEELCVLVRVEDGFGSQRGTGPLLGTFRLPAHYDSQWKKIRPLNAKVGCGPNGAPHHEHRAPR
jgi:hypothetical protein